MFVKIRSVRSFFGPKNQLQSFGTESLNIRIPLKDPQTLKPTDKFINRYENKIFLAYLWKRRMTRDQVWPKIHIIDDIPEEEQPHLAYQQLHPIKKGLDDQLMKKMVQQDPSLVDSSYIISIFGEDYFKEMIDEYVGKVLVCGKAPNDEKMVEIHNEVLELYRAFYFGEKISPLEREIQINYLSQKQQKLLRKHYFPDDKYLQTNWRPSDQRILEDMVNWRDTDLNSSDSNYRPFFEPLDILHRLETVQRLFALSSGGSASFFEKLYFNFAIKADYTVSTSYYLWITDKIFTRLSHYLRCLQFTHTMRIPPDFMIEISIFHIHVWMILERLKDINSKGSKRVAQFFQLSFARYVEEVLGTLNLKKLNVMKRNLSEAMKIQANSLNMHFKGYENTKKNPYYAIDALVWCVVFREKVERYGPEVYMFSEYFIQNYNHIRKFSELDFMNGMIQFDVNLIQPGYEEKIKEINPPLPQEQFEKQFKSDDPQKSYYYKVIQKDAKQEINFPTFKRKKQRFRLFTLEGIAKSLQNFSKRYLSGLDQYDHFNEIDEQKQKAENKAKNSAWKSEKDRLDAFDKQFEEVEGLRKNRKTSTNMKQK